MTVAENSAGEDTLRLRRGAVTVTKKWAEALYDEVGGSPTCPANVGSGTSR